MVIISQGFKSLYQEGFFDKAMHILETEFGLVLGRKESIGTTYRDRIRIWEDEQGVGRYRVHYGLISEQEIAYDSFMFHYWTSLRKSSREIFERDPMRAAYERIFSMATNSIEIPSLRKEKTIEELMGWVERDRARLIKKYGSY